MSNPTYHAISSAKAFGGSMEDYIELHEWFDRSKAAFCDFRHRALSHHALGIYDAQRVFGNFITNSKGRKVPVKLLGEQHVREDCGVIPSLEDWYTLIRPTKWMSPKAKLLFRKANPEFRREIVQSLQSRTDYAYAKEAGLVD